MTKNHQERHRAIILPASLLFISMILFCGSNTLRAEETDHHGEKVDAGNGEACLQCHEDMGEHTHPVMTPYPPVDGGKEYPSVAELAKAGIHIQDGRIICITCHDLKNPAPNHPVRGLTDSSTLCLACHNK